MNNDTYFGKPVSTGIVRALPEVYKEPDVNKMVQAMFAIAEQMAQEEAQGQKTA